MLRIHSKNQGIWLKISLGAALGRSWAALDYFNLAEKSLGISLRAVQGPLELLFFGPRSLQEGSKSPPGGERPPEQILDPSPEPPGPYLARFWLRF